MREDVVDVGGSPRRYLLVTPRTMHAGVRLPLVLVFHGDGGTAVSFHAGYPFERGSGDEAVLAYPDGIGSTWDLETRHGNRDVAFVRALLDTLRARLPIDDARIFATGYSSGGFFSNLLACRLPDTFRAIASNAGGAPYGLEARWPNGYPRCDGQKPVAMLALHGRRDLGVTFDSGRFSAEYWAYVNGCRETEVEPTSYDECKAYRGCSPGKPVALCDVPSLGHWVWDRAAEATWTFFVGVSGEGGGSGREAR
jgi:polyhydroxybutyrate depolymerase